MSDTKQIIDSLLEEFFGDGKKRGRGVNVCTGDHERMCGDLGGFLGVLSEMKPYERFEAWVGPADEERENPE